MKQRTYKVIRIQAAAPGCEYTEIDIPYSDKAYKELCGSEKICLLRCKKAIYKALKIKSGEPFDIGSVGIYYQVRGMTDEDFYKYSESIKKEGIRK